MPNWKSRNVSESYREGNLISHLACKTRCARSDEQERERQRERTSRTAPRSIPLSSVAFPCSWCNLQPSPSPYPLPLPPQGLAALPTAVQLSVLSSASESSLLNRRCRESARLLEHFNFPGILVRNSEIFLLSAHLFYASILLAFNFVVALVV